MKSIFLSFAFRDEDRPLVAAVEQLLASHEVGVVTGKKLGGAALTPAVMARIEECDGLVSLLTRRDQLAGGGWTTHPWVRDELNHARSRNMRAIALVEDGVQTGGAYAEHEWIGLDRENPLEAFLGLSETIGLWKQAAGRTLKVRIMPESLGQALGVGAGPGACRYRFMINGQFTSWVETDLIPETGGTFIYLNGVRDDFMIQIQLEDGPKRWRSVAYPQWLPVELVESGGA